MINDIHAYLHRPSRGFDPIGEEHARKYEKGEAENLTQTERQISELCEKVGGVEGKSILDLGGGPGFCSAAFAKHGAQVTWYDISRRYRDIAKGRTDTYGGRVSYTVGYMDHALRAFGDSSFDLVYNRICWFYCMNDRSFAHTLFRVVKPGGWIFVDNYLPRNGLHGWRYQMNRILGYKIGHPFPAPGRIPALFSSMVPAYMEVTRGPDSEFILVRR